VSRPALDDLLERLCQGDMEAAEQVFVAYEPYLRQVVRRLFPARLRTRFDSIDIVQSAWRDLLEGFREADWRFTTSAQLQAFLVKVTRNRFIDRCRQHSPALDREEPLGDADIACFLPSLEARPSETVQAEELWQRMLALCPPEHHNLLRLKRDGVPVSEIAERTGLHIGSVRRVLRTLALELARNRSA